MKSKIFTLSIMMIAFVGLNLKSAKAQYVTIPDANFVAWLTNYYPACMNGNQMDTTCSGIVNMYGVYVSNHAISDLTGIQYLDSLKVLTCHSNPLISLPNLPSTLVTLNCGGTPMLNLPALPNTLVTLNCIDNQFTSLPALPSSLRYLYCYNNNLNGLPALPDSLIDLQCAGADLSSLTSLPQFLVKFVCSSCQISTMPPLPNTLQYLNCNNNLLTGLPTLSSNLTFLSCQKNQLSSLPSLPNSLNSLWCSNNQLVSLPTLPNHLAQLLCTKNLLTGLPELPSTIGLLRIDSNFIQCLPVLPNILNAGSGLKMNNNLFTCLPNYVPAMDSATLAMPICHDNDTANNPLGCGSASGISGIAYIDNNQNCILGIDDSVVTNIKINFYNPITNQFGATYSNLNGYYNYQCLTGTYYIMVDTINKPYTSNCAYPGLDSIVVSSSANPYIQNVNFDIACKSGNDSGVQSVLVKNGVVFPGQVHTLQINAGDFSQWFGLICSSGLSGQVQVTITGPVAYNGISGDALSPTINGNVYTYNFLNFDSINNSSAFQLLFLTDTTAQGGNQICVHVEVTLDSLDINPLNNIKDFCYSVVNSYDPNYKDVYPVNVEPGYDDWLTYTIHFQNTGNAPAINIRLVDTLDANLNAETFEVINYSHYNTVTLMDGIVDFRFPNILLPDSASDLAGSQGFVQYRIKPKANLIEGTQIENTANIYFDFNAPITTNTTVNNFITEVGLNDIVKSQNISIFPNPSNGIFNLSSTANIEVYNIVGELLLQSNNTKTIDLSNEPNGIYFIKMNGITTKKLIKN